MRDLVGHRDGEAGVSSKPSHALARRGDSPPAPVTREIPQSHYAEAGLLGSMIVDPRCLPEVLRQIEASDFYHAEHGAIFTAIRALYEKNEGRGVDGLLVRQALDDKGLLEKIGEGDGLRGLQYLGQLIESVPSSANVLYYLGIVKEKARRRFLITTGGRINEAAFDESRPLEAVLNDCQAQLFAITERDRRSGSLDALGTLAIAAFEDISRRERGMLRGLSSGFYEIDDKTCGLRPGDMILIAGRPSMGKTSLAMDIALHVGIVQKKSVGVFSLEMSAAQLAERSLCSWAEIDSQQVAHGNLSVLEFQKLAQAAQQFQEARLYIDDGTGLSPFALRSRARQLQVQYGIDLLVIDYVQLMDSSSRAENRQQEITLISRQIKAVARELNIPVLALSQLNRGPEGRDDHRPRMSDLRDSGSLEQDADLIILLHREDYYHRGDETYAPTHIAEAIVAKQRKGPVGTVKLTFREQFSKFVSYSSVPEMKLPPLPQPSQQEEEPF